MTQFNDLVSKSNVLVNADPDQIVLLTLAPCNVQQAGNWQAIEALFQPLVGNGFSVQQVANMQIVNQLAQKMSVMP